MPPRWPRKPDRINDLAFRRLEDRLNFAVHVAAFSAFNSVLWFLQILKPRWDNLPVLTGVWGAALLAHGLYVFVIAKYEEPDASS